MDNVYSRRIEVFRRLRIVVIIEIAPVRINDLRRRQRCRELQIMLPLIPSAIR